MEAALLAKFSQNEDLLKVLLDTTEELVYSSTDNYWGIGGDARGKNMLGRLLMQVRENLRNKQ